MNIGITLAYTQSEKIWNNGIVQNVLNLYFLLKNISDNNTYLVNSNKDDVKERIVNNYDGIILHRLDDYIDTLDLILIIGVEISDEHYDKLKSRGAKIIHYNCGSTFILDMETVLFKDKDTDSRIYRHIPDEVWIIPQNYETNKYYFETIYKVPVKSVPFIWSSFFIDNTIKNNPNFNFHYKPSEEPKRISSFEPNINIVKYSMYNVIISEMLYNERPELIKKLYVTNTDKIIDNKLYINIMQYFNIVKDGIATFEGRYPIPMFLGTYTDVVISHQIFNPLNYSYLDALYLNYPLVHNASMIKDAGYYYEGFNAEQGKEKLLYAITEHDNNSIEYNEKSVKVLDRYLPTNAVSIEIYDKMIKNLFK